MEGNSRASWAEAGIVGFLQSPQNICSKQLQRNEEMVKKYRIVNIKRLKYQNIHALNSLKHSTI